LSRRKKAARTVQPSDFAGEFRRFGHPALTAREAYSPKVRRTWKQGRKTEMAMPAESAPEREHRRRVLKGASILLGIKNSEIACTVRNMHESGAELKVPADARVPDTFLLYIPVDGKAYRCVLRWRKQDRCGVSFTGTEPKPAWHYG
jgi:hypothetical protein